ncbi:hypothetical protein Tco_1355426 [Tanacetum coccineum]
MAGWKPKDLKTKSFANVQELFEKAMKSVNTFVDMDTKLVGGSEVREEGSETREESSSKRAGDELEQVPSKKQKVDDDKENEELKQCMKIISDDGEDDGRIVRIKSLLEVTAVKEKDIHRTLLLVKEPPVGNGTSNLDVESLWLDKRKNRKPLIEQYEAWITPQITLPSGFKRRIVSIEPLIVECRGFAREVIKQLGKIKLEVCFRNEGLSRRTTMKFTVIKAPSSYNIILGRLCLKVLRAIPSTIHSMMKFPIPKGITTLLHESVILSELPPIREVNRWIWKKKATEVERRKEEGAKEISMTEEVLVNPVFPD